MEGFIRGGQGEVRLQDILPPQLSGFSTQMTRAAFAEKYEAEHPGVLVLRDWETAAQIAKRRAERQIQNVERPTEGMDPERARRELRRKYPQLEGLTPDHPEYDKLWANLTREINSLERMCGLEPSRFTKGQAREKVETTVSAEVQEKLNKFAKLSKQKKAASIGATEDTEFLKLIRDTELDDDLRLMAVERLTHLGAL